MRPVRSSSSRAMPRLKAASSGDVVVVLGRARLASTASINGSLVVIGGGSASIASGARVGRDLVVVGGRLDAPAQFTTGGQQIVIGPAVGGALEGVVPWMSRGLIWGRPIVPDLPWVWGIVGIFFIVYLVVSLVFHHPVRASAETLAGRPLTAFVVGLLVLLLTGPVCLLLAVIDHRHCRGAIRALRDPARVDSRQGRRGPVDRDDASCTRSRETAGCSRSVPTRSVSR